MGARTADGNGSVQGPLGVPIPGAHVALRWNFSGEPMCWNDGHCKKTKKPSKQTLQVETDDNGDFSAQLPPGTWDVFIFRDGFVPACAQIFVESGKITTIAPQSLSMAPQSLE